MNPTQRTARDLATAKERASRWFVRLASIAYVAGVVVLTLAVLAGASVVAIQMLAASLVIVAMTVTLIVVSRAFRLPIRRRPEDPKPTVRQFAIVLGATFGAQLLLRLLEGPLPLEVVEFDSLGWFLLYELPPNAARIWILVLGVVMIVGILLQMWRITGGLPPRIAEVDEPVPDDAPGIQPA